MSLINDVLQDLDARRRSEEGPAPDVFAGLRPAAPSPKRRVATRRAAGWGVVSLVMAGSALLVFSSHLSPEAGASPAMQATSSQGPSDASTLARGPAPLASLPEPPVEREQPVEEATAMSAATIAPPAGRRAQAGDVAASEPTPGSTRAFPAAPRSVRPETRESRVEKRNRPPTPAQLAERAYREALRHHELGRWEAARERLWAALEEAPNHRGARLALATLLAQRGELAEAKQLLATGLEASPDHVPFVMLQARILVEMQELGAAARILERGIPPLREDPEAHAFLAALYQRQAKHGRAARLYRDVLRFDSQRGVWWLGLGISLEALGEPGEALAAYRAAREVGRLDPPTRRYLEDRIETLSRGSG